jgi:tRNA A-37 threonylcarbamoyl transferase component Bud32
MSSETTAPRIEQIQFEGKPAWIKRPEAQRSNFYSSLHKGFRYFLPAALQPTGAQGGMSSLLQEAARLKAFAALSVRVPQVYEIADEHIVLSDCGLQLRHILQHSDDVPYKWQLLEKAMTNLAELHGHGLAHGRPHLKDMTVLADHIYLLDLEEDPVAVMDLKYAQARDVWLLLASSNEFCMAPLQELDTLLAVYQDHSKTDIRNEMRDLGRDLRKFRKMIGLFKAQSASLDVSGSYWATKVFEAI